MLIYDNFINLHFLSYLVWVPTFKLINSSSSSKKKYHGGNFTLAPRQSLRGQYKLVGIWFIELTEPSSTLN